MWNLPDMSSFYSVVIKFAWAKIIPFKKIPPDYKSSFMTFNLYNKKASFKIGTVFEITAYKHLPKQLYIQIQPQKIINMQMHWWHLIEEGWWITPIKRTVHLTMLIDNLLMSKMSVVLRGRTLNKAVNLKRD